MAVGQRIGHVDRQMHRHDDALDDCLPLQDASVSTERVPASLRMEDHPATRMLLVLGVKRQVTKTLALGPVPHIKMGSALRFDPKTIAAWLKTRSCK